MKFWLLMITTLIIDWTGVTLAKKYVVTDEWFWIAGSILCFAGLAVAMTELFKIENLAVANAIWAGLAVVGMTLISWLYFGEKLSPAQAVGMILIIGGVILLELPR